MEEVKLVTGHVVSKTSYITQKTRFLIALGYNNLTEQEVTVQVDKILRNEKSLNVIGIFCKADLDIE